MSCPPFITVVSGLPRSGTSLVMQMLAAGGMPVLADGLRTSDDDNPAGYFEFEPVKRTRSDPSWVPLAVGKAVKVIYLLLPELPLGFSYRVIFMRRDLSEVLSSQQKMLQRRGEAGAAIDAADMARIFQRQLESTERWLAGQSSFAVTFIDYRDVVNDPFPHAERIRDFLGVHLDTQAMSAVVDPKLYRQRVGDDGNTHSRKATPSGAGPCDAAGGNL
jgi:hypothetical protein